MFTRHVDELLNTVFNSTHAAHKAEQAKGEPQRRAPFWRVKTPDEVELVRWVAHAEQAKNKNVIAIRQSGIKSAGALPVDLMEVHMTIKAEISAEIVRAKFAYNPVTGHLLHRRGRGRAQRGTRAGSLKPTGYRVVNVNGRFFQSARVAWLHYYGMWPEHQIDHINHCRDDDRIENLRDVTGTVNQHNQSGARKNNTSGCVGVHFNNKEQRWYAVTYLKSKLHFLGSFHTFEDAVAARIEGKARLHEKVRNQ